MTDYGVGDTNQQSPQGEYLRDFEPEMTPPQTTSLYPEEPLPITGDLQPDDSVNSISSLRTVLGENERKLSLVIVEFFNLDTQDEKALSQINFRNFTFEKITAFLDILDNFLIEDFNLSRELASNLTHTFSSTVSTYQLTKTKKSLHELQDKLLTFTETLPLIASFYQVYGGENYENGGLTVNTLHHVVQHLTDNNSGAISLNFPASNLFRNIVVEKPVNYLLVLYELITNAQKAIQGRHIPNGNITINAEIAYDTIHHDPYIIVHVEDNAGGFKGKVPENVSSNFHIPPEHRGYDDESVPTNGTGLQRLSRLVQNFSSENPGLDPRNKIHLENISQGAKITFMMPVRETLSPFDSEFEG